MSLTPVELSRALMRDQWSAGEDIEAMLDSLDEGEVRLLKAVSRKHPRWIAVPPSFLVEGHFDGLADQGLVECDPIDPFRWRVHPKVVRHMQTKWSDATEAWDEAL